MYDFSLLGVEISNVPLHLKIMMNISFFLCIYFIARLINVILKKHKDTAFSKAITLFTFYFMIFSLSYCYLEIKTSNTLSNMLLASFIFSALGITTFINLFPGDKNEKK